jgi:hypothetical protein
MYKMIMKKLDKGVKKGERSYQQVVGCVPFTILNMSLLGSVGIKPTGEEIW